jgi:hypothetical protein
MHSKAFLQQAGRADLQAMREAISMHSEAFLQHAGRADLQAMREAIRGGAIRWQS